MIIRYLDPLERLEFEIIQSREEGIENALITEAASFLNSSGNDDRQKKAKNYLEAIYHIHFPGAGGNREYGNSSFIEHDEDEKNNGSRSDGGKDKANVQGSESKKALKKTEYEDKLLGAWLGRSAGCLLGKPIEKYSRKQIREMLESNGEWPLNHYFTARGMPREILDKYPWKRRGGRESLRENIVCMPEDDDLNYTMLNLHILETYGRDFTSVDVGQEWLKMMPVLETFTAERVAYQNLLSGIDPPESGLWLNPFREWIGAWIRADLWGYVNPGDPGLAADFARRDALVSHSGNGVYGEMFFAALISMAFVEDEAEKCINTALSFIPGDSRFALGIKFAVKTVKKGADWESIVDEIYKELGHYHWVHSINNAAVVTAALLHGQGDYEKSICNAVMAGWDTDCTAATLGSILGAMQGANALPEKWTAVLRNRIRSSVKGFDNITFTKLAERTAVCAEAISKDEKKDRKYESESDY